jgi:prevent-host-death family protein
MKAWQVQEAKMHLSDLIRNAKLNPQLITVRGNAAVVVISTKQYSKLNKSELSIFDVMQKFPYKKMELAPKRSADKKLRKIKL